MELGVQQLGQVGVEFGLAFNTKYDDFNLSPIQPDPTQPGLQFSDLGLDSGYPS